MVNDLIFVQMSGAPGSGKSTIARSLAPLIGAVVIDHDITKTALLDWDIPVEAAGRASYGVLDALARDLLSQGRSVIFDSPCFYADLLERGLSLARAFGARYRYIECVVTDTEMLDRRLQARDTQRSQRRGIAIPPVDVGDVDVLSKEAIHKQQLENTKRPSDACLSLDTTMALETCIRQCLDYVQSRD